MKLQPLECYCATLRQAARAVTLLYEEALAGTGLHATQYTALQVLERAPHRTISEVGRIIGIDQTTATRTLALVKKAGFAIDSVGDDRRERRWALTPKGRDKLRAVLPRWEAAQRAFEKRVGRGEAVALREASHRAARELGSE